MTPQQLVDDLERRRNEASRLMDASLAVTSPGAPGQVNPIVAEALAGGAPVPPVNPVLETAKELSAGVSATPAPAKVAGTPGFNPKAAEPRVVPAPQVDTEETGSFYDMLLRNDAYRLANKEAYERNEKANRARTTIAAVTDALASLGNLVGTTQGAFSQPQTYQTPFVTEQVEADRARARQLADRIQASDQSIRLTQARENLANGAYALKQALEEEKTRRAMMNNDARAALSAQNAAQKSDLYGEQHGYRADEIAQRGDITLKGIEMRNAQSDINNRRTTGTSAANNIRNNETRKEVGGGGAVGGYTTSETITYDDLGRKTGSTKTRTANGQTTTTTTTSGGSASGKKPNPMGSAPKPEVKKKKKNPMN